MANVTASVAASLPGLGVAPVTPADAFFGAAEQFLIGARILVGTPAGLAFTFVCGQVTENLLKAFLWWKGVAVEELKGKLGHDLSGLRARAVAHGLTVEADEPPWFTLLDSLHDRPFLLRYPMGLNGMVMPPMTVVLNELEALLELARAARQ